MKRKIVIVEDETAIRENYAAALTRSGHAVVGFDSRASAAAALEQELPDLVIIDIGLGDEYEGGFELCRDLRSRDKSLPIIFLTARDSELDEISGLRLGADDYLTKDISIAQLQVRVSALFRRIDALNSSHLDEQVHQVGPLKIETERMRVRWGDKDVHLTVTEFWIVTDLARRPEHVKSRGQLMDAANILVSDATVTCHIKRIRNKFKEIDPNFDAIDAVHGVGYRWLAV